MVQGERQVSESAVLTQKEAMTVSATYRGVVRGSVVVLEGECPVVQSSQMVPRTPNDLLD